MSITITFDGLKASYDGKIFDVSIHPTLPISSITQICAIIKTLHTKITECRNNIEREPEIHEKLTQATIILKSDILTLLSFLIQPHLSNTVWSVVLEIMDRTKLLSDLGIDTKWSDMDYRKFIKFVR